MIYIVLMTYHCDNIIISLKSLSRLYNDSRIIIHNDNPDFTLSFSDYPQVFDIINEVWNQGMLGSRINTVLYFKDRLEKYGLGDNDKILFIDDDDILFPFKVPEFMTPKYMTNYIEVRKVHELLNLYTRTGGSLVEYIQKFEKVPNYTISGNVYRLKELIEFNDIFVRYLPKIKEILQTNKIMSSEDDIYDGCYYQYVKNCLGKTYCYQSNDVACCWNCVESPIGRYEVDDQRYSDDPDGKKSKEFEVKFRQVLDNFKPWYESNYLPNKS